MTLRDSHSSGTPLARRLEQPTRVAGLEAGLRHGLPRALPPLFGLAPGGVCHAGDVTAAAVRSYRTVSPLPRTGEPGRGGLFSVALSLGSPPAAVSRHRASMEPGLSSTSIPILRPECQQRPSGRLTPRVLGSPAARSKDVTPTAPMPGIRSRHSSLLHPRPTSTDRQWYVSPRGEFAPKL